MGNDILKVIFRIFKSSSAITFQEKKKRQKLLFPGSEEACRKGCICPVVENRYGDGAYLDSEGKKHFIYDVNCLIHGDSNSYEKNILRKKSGVEEFSYKAGTKLNEIINKNKKERNKNKWKKNHVNSKKKN